MSLVVRYARLVENPHHSASLSVCPEKPLHTGKMKASGPYHFPSDPFYQTLRGSVDSLPLPNTCFASLDVVSFHISTLKAILKALLLVYSVWIYCFLSLNSYVVTTWPQLSCYTIDAVNWKLSIGAPGRPLTLKGIFLLLSHACSLKSFGMEKKVIGLFHI